MKVTVNKYLNARIGEASTNATCKFYRMPGDTLEIDDVLVGTEVDGNSVWFHCKDDGCYYWSGGIEEVDFQLEQKVSDDEILSAIAKDIQNNFTIQFKKKIQGYSGCGIGYKNNNESLGLSLVFFVEKKINDKDVRQPAPPFIVHKGLKIITDVIELSGELHNYKKQNQSEIDLLDTIDPLSAGGRVYQAGFEGNFGSRTIKILFNRKWCLLSCYHVMAKSLLDTKHYSILPTDLKIFVNIPHPTLPAQRISLRVIRGKIDSDIDYAIAEFENQKEANLVSNFYNNKLIKDLMSQWDLQSFWKKNISSIGAFSGFQTGKVLYTNGEKEIRGITFRNIIITERISDGGDSGAPVVANDKLVGYVFAGDKDKVSYIMPAYKLLKQISFSLK